MVRIDRMGCVNIYSNSDGGYIVHNTHKEFAKGHTHINNYKTARFVAYLVIYKKIPKKNHLSNYLIESVVRLSTDKKYIDNITKLKK